MNTPNKLTVLRFLLVPVFLVFFLIKEIPYNYLYAFVIFIVASLTDLLDGYLARKYNQVTTFGKFLDPLADKVLVVSVLICFVDMSLANAIVVIIIIAREFIVTSLRLVALSSDGTVIAADNLAKIKTVIQMVSITTILLALGLSNLGLIPEVMDITIFSNVLMWIAAFITVLSGGSYLMKNMHYITKTK